MQNLLIEEEKFSTHKQADMLTQQYTNPLVMNYKSRTQNPFQKEVTVHTKECSKFADCIFKFLLPFYRTRMLYRKKKKKATKQPENKMVQGHKTSKNATLKLRLSTLKIREQVHMVRLLVLSKKWKCIKLPELQSLRQFL